MGIDSQSPVSTSSNNNTVDINKMKETDNTQWTSESSDTNPTVNVTVSTTDSFITTVNVSEIIGNIDSVTVTVYSQSGVKVT